MSFAGKIHRRGRIAALRCARIGVLVVFLAGASRQAGGFSDFTPDTASAWLELPQLAVRVTGDGSIVIPGQPEFVHQLVLHLPRGGSGINYGKIHTKVNTEATDTVMRSVGLAEGTALQLDLAAGSGFLFNPGRNSVELEFEDRFGRTKYFNFLLTFGGSSDRNLTPLTPGKPGIQSPPRRRGPGKLFAVVIGISHYTDPAKSIPNLLYADADARAFATFLQSPAGGSVAPENLLLLLNEEATAPRVRGALFTFLTHPQPEDTVIIYIAGHGAQDPNDPRNLYLITSDTRRDDMGGTAFPMWQMQDVFARILKAERVITFADTCHSYGFSGRRAGDEHTHGNNLFNQYIEHYGSIHQQAVLTASDISETSQEGPEWGGGHGVFTWFLLKGLAGAADRNHDGIVTAGELFPYLRQSVREVTSGTQNPRALAGLASSLVLSRSAKPRPGEHPAVGSQVEWASF